MSLLKHSTRFLRQPIVLTSRWSPVVHQSRHLAISTNEYDEKNKKLGRPVSPHLTVYAIQLTSVLSITTRITGAAFATLLYGGASLYAISPYEFSQVAHLLASLPSPVLFGGKFALAFPFMYHNLSGIRHLIWDTGCGLTIPAVYKSGYVVLAATLLSAGALAYC